MIRILPALLLFFLPFLAYAVVLHLRARNPFLRDSWDRHPLIWLSIAGLIAVLIGFFMFMRWGNDPQSSVYVPARMENGVFIPGEVRHGPAPKPVPAPP